MGMIAFLRPLRNCPPEKWWSFELPVTVLVALYTFGDMKLKKSLGLRACGCSTLVDTTR